MKGIAHFCSGIAVASFLPQVVERSAQGSFVLLLAGLGSLVPDVLDFRLARFWAKPDLEIAATVCGGAACSTDCAGNRAEGDGVPGGWAQTVAECLAETIARVYRTGKTATARLGTIKVDVDLWLRYSVRFEGGQVRVRSGPTVDGSQQPVHVEMHEGVAPISVPLRQASEATVTVSVFSGTALEFREHQEEVEVIFLPWHRRWSHSLTLVALLGGITAVLLGPLAGGVIALGTLTHILEDQLGYMGSNLLYPVTRRRSPGLRLFHSGDALPNFFTVWLSVILLLLNLDRFAPAPVFDPWRLLFVGLVVPWVAIAVLHWWSQRGKRAHRRVDGRDALPQDLLVDVGQDGERTSAPRRQIDGG